MRAYQIRQAVLAMHEIDLVKLSENEDLFRCYKYSQEMIDEGQD